MEWIHRLLGCLLIVKYCYSNAVSSVHKPKFYSCASWSLTRTVATSSESTSNQSFFNAFIDINDTLYVADRTNKNIHILSEKNDTSKQIILTNLTLSIGLFVTSIGDIYLDHGNHSQVTKRSVNTIQSTTVMYVNRGCSSLFVTTNYILYCSINNGHLVVKMPLNTNHSQLSAAAGTGCPGSTSNMLDRPSGIYVDVSMDLYVADTGNNRIQLFRSNILNGTTVIGRNGSLSYPLDQPTSVILDADNSLFIVDSGNHRIIRSTSYGKIQCIIGCSIQSCSQSNALCHPFTAIFSSDGSIYVTNQNNIQKYILTTNSCDATTTEEPTTITMSSASCLSPTISLFPQSSDIEAPVTFRRSQDFYITGIIKLKCTDSVDIETKWSIFNCTLNCSVTADIDPSINTTFNEIYFPSRSLTYGLYQMKLTVTMVAMPNIMTNVSTFVRVDPSAINANLVQWGTSLVTSGENSNLTFDPGTYSINPDESTFNASDWTYDYVCRLQTTIQIVTWLRFNESNNTCFINRKNSAPAWTYNSVNASQSSVTILAGSLKTNHTYQFAVFMRNLRNKTAQATGYVLVNIEPNSPQMIEVTCVISTMCSHKQDYQYINPSTQVALLSECADACRSILNIRWNIYQGFNDSTTNFVTWIPFTSNFLFFGMNTSRFTVSNSLFLNNSKIFYWRFEVVYTFSQEISTSALNFVINQPPENGTCSIHPRNGTTSTIFHINCTNWIDQDGVKDYSFYFGTTPSEQIMLAFTTLPTLSIQLPAVYGNQSGMNIVAHIRDMFDCVKEYKMESVTVVPDQTAINAFIDAIDIINNQSTSNAIVRALANRNQNEVEQTVILLSYEFNERNKQDLEMAIQNGTPTASISVSPLGSETVTTTNNGSISSEYKQKLTKLAIVRNYLMKAATRFSIMNIDSIKLQANTLTQLTKSTNELTRSGSMLAATKCHQFIVHLHTMARRVPYEDAFFVTNHIAQCINNVLIAVNAPLGSRSVYLDVPEDNESDDYNSDSELFQITSELLDNEHNIPLDTIKNIRIRYYQQKTANQIAKLAIDIFSRITSILNIHLNIGQETIIKSPSLFVSLEKIPFESLFNKSIKQLRNTRIHIPPNIQSDLNRNALISLRSTLHSLASHGSSQFQTYTNMSTMISLTVLDQNGNERSLHVTNDQPIEFFIPRDPNLIVPKMNLHNVTSKSSEEPYLLNLNQFLINRNLTMSLHFEIQPIDTDLGYFFIYKFDKEPKLNNMKYDIDGWALFCPANIISKDVYTYFIDNRQTAGHSSLIFKFRELNSMEVKMLCQNQSFDRPPIFNEPANFTADYRLRIYSSGCYYLDQYNNWQSDGLWVGPLTDHHQTHCFSTHLISF